MNLNWMQADQVALSKCKSTVEELNQGLPGPIHAACVREGLEHRVTCLESLTTWPTSVFYSLKPIFDDC